MPLQGIQDEAAASCRCSSRTPNLGSILKPALPPVVGHRPPLQPPELGGEFLGGGDGVAVQFGGELGLDRKSTRLNSSHT